MKFRDKKTGEVLDTIDQAYRKFCDKHSHCIGECVLAPFNSCSSLARERPGLVAHLMGYEVIEEKPYDSSRTCGICEHSKPFGIYGTVKCTKTDRYLPCEHKCDWEEANMEKQDKPRLAEVLGVVEDEEWNFPGLIRTCRIHNGVRECFIAGEWKLCDNEGILTHIINHPESIIHVPHLTEPEIAIMRDCGAKWVSRDDALNDGRVDLWENKPIFDRGAYISGDGNPPVARVLCKLFETMKPGDCIGLEDAE